MAKPKSAKKEYPNSGTINAVKDSKQQPTDRVTGDLDIAGDKFKLSGTKFFDDKNRLTIKFSLNQVDTQTTIFGSSEVVSEDGNIRLNDRRSTKNSPEWRGGFSIGKQKYRASGWVNHHDRYGDFISLKLQTEEAYQAVIAKYKEEGKELEPEDNDTTDPGF